jgi:predicted secreted protein
MAASTTPMNSTKWFLAYSTDGGTTIVKVGELQSKTLNRTMEPRETTGTDSGGDASFGEGKKSWSLSGEFHPLFGAGSGFANEDDLHTLYDERTSARWYFGTENAGDTQYYGTGWITALNTSGGYEDNIVCSIEIQGSGALTSDVVS